MVVTYEGDATWEREGLAVRYGVNGGGEETVERFETSGDEVEHDDAVSVNTGDTGGKVEAVGLRGAGRVSPRGLIPLPCTTDVIPVCDEIL